MDVVPAAVACPTVVESFELAPVLATQLLAPVVGATWLHFLAAC